MLFSKTNQVFLGCFDPVDTFTAISKDNLQGELTDVSTETKTLLGISVFSMDPCSKLPCGTR